MQSQDKQHKITNQHTTKSYNFATKLKTLKESQAPIEKKLFELEATITLGYNAQTDITRHNISYGNDLSSSTININESTTMYNSITNTINKTIKVI